jgi:predicted RNase H-like nuclease (RuvC/YqgF family)
MGVDVTLNIQQQGASLLEALNDVITLNQKKVEQRKNLETRASTIKRLRKKIKEQEEKICQLRKKIHPTGEETPLEQTESENSAKSAETTNSEPSEQA